MLSRSRRLDVVSLSRILLGAACFLAGGCTEAEPLYCDRQHECAPPLVCRYATRTCEEPGDAAAPDQKVQADQSPTGEALQPGPDAAGDAAGGSDSAGAPPG